MVLGTRTYVLARMATIAKLQGMSTSAPLKQSDLQFFNTLVDLLN
jgi:hypothetical protein